MRLPSAAVSPSRKDAARNHARLLDSAKRLFGSRGLAVTLKDVVRDAEVGVGTVYRHFPTKDALVAALFAGRLRQEVEPARATAEAGDAWRELVDYLEETMRPQESNRGLRALMCPAGSVFEAVRECKAEINPHFEQVIELAHSQGSLRPDCTARDIAHLRVALVGIMDASPDDALDFYRRHSVLFLDGMRTDRSW